MTWLPLCVGLAWASETALEGPLRWFALAAALSIAVSIERPRVTGWPRPCSIVAAILLATAAGFAHSPLLAGLAAVALLAQPAERRAPPFVLLTLAALGIHIAWWNYISVLRPMRIPEVLGKALSWLSGGTFHLTAAELIIEGQAVSLSIVDLMPILSVTLAFAALRREKRRMVLISLGALLASVLIWLVAIAAISARVHQHFFSSFWQPLASVGLAFLVNWCSWRFAKDEPPSAVQFRWGWWTGTVLLAAGIVLGSWTGSRDRQLSIAFDEAHGKWETAEGVFDAQHYGRDSVYNYVVLRQWLERRHKVVLVRDRVRTLHADVFIVKMPTSFYAPEEKRALDKFLRDGGTVIVLGDHTNLFGTSLVLNDLLEPYGIRIHHDATVPWEGEHFDFQPAWWHRTRFMRGIDKIQIQTAATISARSPAIVPFLVGDRVVGEAAEYSNERFFGELHPGVEDTQPPIAFGVYRWVGKGRLFVFTDSTIFSNFSVMAPGNARLMQNILRDVARESRFREMIALVAVGVLLVLGSRKWGGARVLGLLAAVPIIVALTAESRSASAPEQKYPGRWLDIDAVHSRLELRADPRVGREEEFEDYSTWFAWLARTGRFPEVNSLDAYADPKTPTVILNPDQPFSTADLDRVETYVRRGGRLLILDDPRFRVRSTAEPLLERFGAALRPTLIEGSVHDPAGRLLSESLLGLPFDLLRYERRTPGAARVERTGVAYALSGMTALLTDEQGVVIAGEKDVGQGRVLVFSRSSVFSEFVMGDVWGGTDVAPNKRAVYDLLFTLMSRLTP